MGEVPVNGPANAIFIALCGDHEHIVLPKNVTPERLESVAAGLVAGVACANARVSGFPEDVAAEEIGSRIVRRAGDMISEIAK